MTSELQTKSLCLSIRFSKWGTHRKTDVTPDAETNADKSFLGVSKKLIDAKEVKAIGRIDHDLIVWLRRNCVSFPLQQGVYLVPVAMVQRTQERIDLAKRERAGAIDRLVEAMPLLREEARLRLADLYDADQYPEGDALRACYNLDHAYVSFDVPGMLKDLDASLFSKEQQRQEIRWQEASEEIRYALREAFAELTRRLAERLTPGEDGKAKVFRDSALENLKEFIEGFAVRNLANDDELAAAVAAAKSIVSGLDPKSLRKSDTVKARVSGALSEVCTKLDGMVKDKPARRFAFDEE